MLADNVRDFYARKFGLPAEQVKLFGELNPKQVCGVRRYFSAGLVNVENYVYAIKGDGELVWERFRRDRLMEGSEA